MSSVSDRQRILLIEDEPAIADTILYALNTEGFDPSWYSTAREGLQAFREQPPDLVILDINLPDDNGFEVCKKLFQISKVPLIFVSARDAEIDRVVGLEIGADDYITKPFSPRELSARVRAVLRRTQPLTPSAADASRSPVFSIDNARREIRYQGQTLTLSRYEYRLLRLLIQSPERVYTREQLLQLVWDSPEHRLDRTVDTHIKTLRAKLRTITPEQDPIQTHRGIGYSMSVSV